MKLVFAGTPPFAARSLGALVRAGHQVTLVLTRPDKPAGRGMEPQISAVKAFSLERSLALYQPPTLKEQTVLERLRTAAADVMVVAAYGLILPQSVLDIPRHGALNVHASLLPRWRGAAPIERALLSGDRQTGISIMQMDAGLDTGPVLLSARTPIADDDTAGTLTERLADMGAALLLEALDGLSRGELRPQRQDDALATYAAKLQKSESRIEWHADASAIHRQIRACNPVPGCTTRIRGLALKIWQAAMAGETSEPPGAILEVDNAGIVVACGHGALRLTQLQRPGGRKLPAADFLRGFALMPGERFEL